MSKNYGRNNSTLIGILKALIFIVTIPIIIIFDIFKMCIDFKSEYRNYDEITYYNKNYIENLNKDKIMQSIKKYKIILIILMPILILTIAFCLGNIKLNTTLFIISLICIIVLSIIIKIIIERYKSDKTNLTLLENEKNYKEHLERVNIENEKFEEYKKSQQEQKEEKKSRYHIKTQTITNNEKYFLNIIKKQFDNDYEIRVQVPLASVIEKDKDFPTQYQNELNRIIDIGMFDKESSYPLLLIEINDPTHYRKDRQIRDAKLNKLCDEANIKLIEFWTENNNSEEYIIEQINKNLGR